MSSSSSYSVIVNCREKQNKAYKMWKVFVLFLIITLCFMQSINCGTPSYIEDPELPSLESSSFAQKRPTTTTTEVPSIP